MTSAFENFLILCLVMMTELLPLFFYPYLACPMLFIFSDTCVDLDALCILSAMWIVSDVVSAMIRYHPSVCVAGQCIIF